MRVRRSGEPRGAATARMPIDGPAEISAPLFRVALDQAAEDRRCVMLDLGQARSSMLALLEGRRCHMYVANLQEAFAAHDAPEDTDRIAEIAGTLHALCEPEPVDLVFAWDFLNYLEGDALAAFMAALAERCRPGALVHALIVYSERMMPQVPGLVVPVAAGKLVNRGQSQSARVAPRYSPDDLRRCTSAYDVDSVRLLSNGMQEYLLRLRE